MSNKYDTLALVGMIAVPLAPAFFFGYAVYSEVNALTAVSWLSILIGIAAAVGLEAVGILAGHVINTAWTMKDYGRMAVGSIIMLIYVAIGIIELRGSIGAVMFLISPLVYILAAVQQGLATAANRQERDTAVNQQAQMEDKRRQADHNRQMELAAQQLAHDIALEKLRLKAQTNQPKASESQRKPAESLNLSGNNLKVYEAFTRNPKASNVEIGQNLGLSGQRVGQIKKELNGLVKEVTK